VFNMGVLPIFVAYPLVYRVLARGGRFQNSLAVVSSAVIALQLGALAVVLETVLSGRTELPLRAFLLAMLPIHLAIGVVEGFVTLAILGFLRRARPEILEGQAAAGSPLRAAALVGALALILGGWIAWYASQRPDGLEWAVHKVTGHEALPVRGALQARITRAQASTAALPDYAFRGKETSRAGTSFAGVTGGLLTLALVAGAGWVLKRRRP